MAKNPSISLEIDVDTIPGKIEVDKLVKEVSKQVTKSVSKLNKLDVTPDVVLNAKDLEKNIKPKLEEFNAKLAKVFGNSSKDFKGKYKANLQIAEAFKKEFKEAEGLLDSEGKIIASKMKEIAKKLQFSFGKDRGGADAFFRDFSKLSGKSMAEATAHIDQFAGKYKVQADKIDAVTEGVASTMKGLGANIKSGLQVADTYMNQFTSQQKARMQNLQAAIQKLGGVNFDFDLTSKSDTRDIEEINKLLGEQETILRKNVAHGKDQIATGARTIEQQQQMEAGLHEITEERRRLSQLVKESTVNSKAETESLKNSRAHLDALKVSYLAIDSVKKRLQGYSGKEESVIKRQVDALLEQQKLLQASLKLRDTKTKGSEKELALEKEIHEELKKIDLLIQAGKGRQETLNNLKKEELAEQKRITAQNKATRKEIQGYLFDVRELNKALTAAKSGKVDDAGLKNLKDSIALTAKLDKKITEMRRKVDEGSIVLSSRDLENLDKAQAKTKAYDLELKKILATTERIIKANKDLTTSLRVGKQANELAEVNAALTKQIAAKTQINQLHAEELRHINGKEVLELDQEIARLTTKKLHLEQINTINKEINAATAKAALLAARGSNATNDKSRLDLLKKELNLREDLLAKMKAINDTPNSGVSFNSDALKKAADAVTELNAKVKVLTKSLDRNASEATELDTANKHLTKTLKAQEDAVTGVSTASTLSASKQIASLQRLEKAIQDSLVAYSSQAKAAGRAGTDTKQYTSEIKRLRTELAKVERSLNGPTRSMSEFSNSLRLFFRYAVAYRVLGGLERGFRAITSAVVELDQSLVSIQAVANATAEDMVTIENAIKNVATTTKFSTAEIASSAQVLAQAGIGPDSIAATLESVANFASATNASLEIAADLISTMKNVFTELSVEDIADKLANTVNISKTTAADLQTILSRLAQTSGSFNINADQMLAAVSVLKNVGIKASTVSTGLRQGLLELLSPDAKTLKVLEKRYDAIGQTMSKNAISGMFTGFADSDNPLLAVLNELEKLGISGSGEQDFERLFDVRATNVINALIKNKEQFIANTQAIQRTGSAAKGAKTQLQSLANAADNLGAVISVLASDVSGKLVSGLKDLVKSATEATNSFREMLKARQEATGESGIGDVAELGLTTGVAAKSLGLGVIKSAAIGLVAAMISGAATAVSDVKDKTASKLSDALSTVAEVIITFATLKAFFPTATVAVMAKAQAGLSKALPALKGLGGAIAFFGTKFNLVVLAITSVASLIYAFAKDSSGDALKAIEAQRDAIASKMAETSAEIAKIEAEIKRQEASELKAVEVQQDLKQLDETISAYLDKIIMPIGTTVEEVLALNTTTEEKQAEIKAFLDKAAQGTKDVQSAAFQNMKSDFEELLGLTEGALKAYDLAELLQGMGDQVTKAEGVRAEYQKALDAALRDSSLTGAKDLVAAFNRATDAEKKLLLGRINNQEEAEALYAAIKHISTVKELSQDLAESKASLDESIEKDLEAKGRAYATLQRDVFKAEAALSKSASGGTLPFGLQGLIDRFNDPGELQENLDQAQADLKAASDIAVADLIKFTQDHAGDRDLMAKAFKGFIGRLTDKEITDQVNLATDNLASDFTDSQNDKIKELETQLEVPKELLSLQEAVIGIEEKKLVVAEESLEIEANSKNLSAEKQSILKDLIALEKKKALLVNEDDTGKKKYDAEIDKLRLDLTGINKKILASKKVQQTAEEKIAEQARGQLFEEGRLKDITEEIARAKGAAVKDTVLIASLIEEQYQIEKQLLAVKKADLEANIAKQLRSEGIDASGQDLDQLLQGLDNESGRELLKANKELAKFVKEGIEVQDKLNKAQEVYTNGIKDLKKIAIDAAKKKVTEAQKENDALRNTSTVLQNKLNDATDSLREARLNLAKAYDAEKEILKSFQNARDQIDGRKVDRREQLSENIDIAGSLADNESAVKAATDQIASIVGAVSAGEISKSEGRRLLDQAEAVARVRQADHIAELRRIEAARADDVRNLRAATKKSWETTNKNTQKLEEVKNALSSLEASLVGTGQAMANAAAAMNAAAGRVNADGTPAAGSIDDTKPLKSAGTDANGNSFSSLPSSTGDLTKAVKIVDKDGRVTYTSNPELINQANELGSQITDLAAGNRTGAFDSESGKSPEQLVMDMVSAVLGGSLEEGRQSDSEAIELISAKIEEVIQTSMTPEEAKSLTPKVGELAEAILDRAKQGGNDGTVYKVLEDGTVAAIKGIMDGSSIKETGSEGVAKAVADGTAEGVKDVMPEDMADQQEQMAETIATEAVNAVQGLFNGEVSDEALEEIGAKVTAETFKAIGTLLSSGEFSEEEIAEVIKSVTDKTKTKIEELLASGEFTEEQSQAVTNFLTKGTIDSLEKLFVEVAASEESAAKITEAVTTGTSEFISNALAEGEGSEQLVNAVANPIEAAITSGKEVILNTAAEALGFVMKQFDIKPSMKPLEDSLKSSADNIKQGGENAGEAMSGAGQTAGQGITQAGTAIVQAILTAARNIASAAAAARAPVQAPQGKADGGFVRGPGTTTSDDIPVMLSDKEYVLDAETTKNIGVQTLDTLRGEKGKVQEKGKGGKIKKLARGGSVTPYMEYVPFAPKTTTPDPQLGEPIVIEAPEAPEAPPPPSSTLSGTNGIAEVLSAAEKGIQLSGYDISVAFWKTAEETEDASDDIDEATDNLVSSIDSTTVEITGAASDVSYAIQRVADSVGGISTAGDSVADSVLASGESIQRATDESSAVMDAFLAEIGAKATAGDAAGESISSSGEGVSSALNQTAQGIDTTSNLMLDYWKGQLEEQKRILAATTIGWANAFNMQEPLSELEQTINEFKRITAISKWNRGVESSAFTRIRAPRETGPTSRFRGFAEGGPVKGPGTGTSDSIIAKLSDGEFVVDAKTTKNVGADNLADLPKFSSGGLLDLMKPNKIDPGSLLSSRRMPGAPKMSPSERGGGGSSQKSLRPVVFNVGNASLSADADDSRVQDFGKALNIARLKGGNR